MSVIDEISAEHLRTDLPELNSGDTVRVSARVREGNRERVQVFEGTVMRLRGGGISRSLTVRAIRSGVGVERTFKVRPSRTALLPAQARRQGRFTARAPSQLICRAADSRQSGALAGLLAASHPTFRFKRTLWPHNWRL